MKRFEPGVKILLLFAFLTLTSAKCIAACSTPLLVTTDSITATSVRLSWLQIGGVTGWEIEAVPDGQTPTGIPTASTTVKPYTLSGLQPCTGYKIYIRAICSPTMISAWSTGKQFYTAVTNPSCCHLNYLINDNALSNFKIDIQNAPGTQLGTDLVLKEVRLVVEHSWNADLDIYLKSPSGLTVELSTDNGDGDDNYGNPADPGCSDYSILISPASFEACSTISVVEGEAPFSGTFNAEGDFSNFNDNSNPNGIWTLSVLDDALSDYGYLQYVELVFEPFYCDKPSSPDMINVSAHTASMTWTPGSTCNYTLLEYGPPGFIPGIGGTAGEGIIVNIPCPVNFPYILEGLTDDSSYDIYIREACTNGGISENTCTASIVTHCDVPPPTLSEDFDAQLNCSTSCSEPCHLTGNWHNTTSGTDWIVNSGQSPSTDTGPPGDINNDGNYIYFESSECADNSTATLITDCLEVPSILSGDCHMSFYYHMYGATMGNLSLEITNDGGNNWSVLWTKAGNQGNNWFKQFISLAGFEGDIVQLRFRGVKGSGVTSDMAIDHIEFYGTTLAGNPEVFYVDNDQDGFGNPDQFILRCTQVIPAGYTLDNTDCDDTNAGIFPAAAEISCNLVDEDCDGLSDDNVLPPPVTTDANVCFGNNIVITPANAPLGNYYWYDAPVDGNLLFVGNSVTTANLTSNWVVYVRDSVTFNSDYGCASALDTISITVRPFPQINFINSPSICEGNSYDLQTLDINGSDLLGVTYTYHSSTPATSDNQINPVVTPLSDIIYFVKATSAYGCTDEFPMGINVNPKPSPQIQQGSELDLCIGNVAILNVSESGTGIPPISWQWNNGSTNSQITILSNGDPETVHPYVVTAIDANNCTAKDTIVVTLHQSIDNITATTVPVTTCNSNNGSIELSFNSAYPPYIISWSGSSAGSSATSSEEFVISGLSEGTYNVTISDNAPVNCPVIIPFLIINGPNVMVNLDSIRHISCNGGEDGGIFLTITGNNPDNIQWSYNNITSPDLIDIPSGLYSVTVTAGQCEARLENIQVNQPDLLQAFVLSTVKTSCFGVNDAVIDISVAGGTTPYTYHWNNSFITQDATGISPGFYSVTVTDANGCTTSLTSILIEPTFPLAAFSYVENPTCWYSQDGSIDISPVGGTPPYHYLWNNSQTTEDLLDIGNGIYSVQITDAKGCSFYSNNIAVASNPPISLTSAQVTPPTCQGIDNGSINIGVNGGSGNYSYDWNNDAETQDINGLAADIYRVTITDDQGCVMVSENIAVIAPTLMNFIPVIENASCEGIENGSILLYITGGTPSYDISWNNNQQGALVSGLSMGTYYATVTDANGCQQMTPNWYIESPQLLSYSIDLIDSVRCHGEDNGKLFLTFQGGLPGYTALWNNGMSGDDFTELAAGDYILTLTDSEGCTLTDTLTIPEPELLVAQINTVDPIMCQGECNGSIDIEVSGGTSPYTYSWLNGVTIEDLNGICAGTYQSNVTDFNGCITSTPTVNLDPPEAMHIEVDAVSNVSCDGNTGGSIFLSVEGGVPEFEYHWNTGDSLSMLTDLPGGEYNVTVTDANGCTKTIESIKVVEPTVAFQVDTVLITQAVTCFGSLNGGLEAFVAGGSPPYQYNWSSGFINIKNEAFDNIQSLSGGCYNLTVTDNGGCVTISDSICIFEPAPLNYAAEVTNIACFGDNSGSIDITIFGGTAPFSYLWSNSDTTQHIDMLEAGNYSVTVTDINGCSDVFSPAEVHAPASGLSIINDTVEPVLCYGDATGTVSINIIGGSPPYDINWNNDLHTNVITQLTTGEYYCTIEDNNGCIFISDTYEVLQPLTDLGIQFDAINHNDCPGGADGSILITPIGGSGLYTFEWSNQTFDEDAAGLVAGIYGITITDSHQCQDSSGVLTIFSPDEFIVMTDIVNATGNQNNGSASVQVSGATPPYTYLWDQATGNQVDSVAVNLVGGDYTVTITDANDCTTSTMITVDKTVSVPAGPWSDKVVLYPNPTNGLLHIDLRKLSTANFHIKVYHTTGILIQEWNDLNPSDVILMDLSSSPAGSYWLEITEKKTQKHVFPFLKL